MSCSGFVTLLSSCVWFFGQLRCIAWVTIKTAISPTLFQPPLVETFRTLLKKERWCATVLFCSQVRKDHRFGRVLLAGDRCLFRHGVESVTMEEVGVSHIKGVASRWKMTAWRFLSLRPLAVKMHVKTSGRQIRGNEKLTKKKKVDDLTHIIILILTIILPLLSCCRAINNNNNYDNNTEEYILSYAPNCNNTHLLLVNNLATCHKKSIAINTYTIYFTI